LRKASFSGINI